MVTQWQWTTGNDTGHGQSESTSIMYHDTTIDLATHENLILSKKRNRESILAREERTYNLQAAVSQLTSVNKVCHLKTRCSTKLLIECYADYKALFKVSS